MKFKHMLCAALGVAMLSTSALGVGGDLLISPAPISGADYTIEAPSALPITVWGRVETLEEGRVELKNSNESDPYSHIVLNVSENTVILDAVTGAVKTSADLKKGETLYASVGPAMTRSMPPIANAELILCNLPADFIAPTFAEVQSVETNEDGRTSALMSGEIILHLTAETEILSAPGVTGAVLADVVPGARVLAWYDIVAMSMPGQANPAKIMVFPYNYGGWIEASPEGVSLSGTALALAANQTPFAQDGKLMLPLRAVAEALDCKVLWDPASPNTVTVERDGAAVYALELGGETVTMTDGAVALTHLPVTVDGVTFLAAEDIIMLHNLKLVAA